MTTILRFLNGGDVRQFSVQVNEAGWMAPGEFTATVYDGEVWQYTTDWQPTEADAFTAACRWAYVANTTKT